MQVALRIRVAFLSGVKPLQVPDSPYYLIYSPPVNLAKAPDTTAHGRKPGS